MIITRNQPFVTKICGRFFYPGNNIIADDVLAKKIIADPVFKNFETLGHMEIVKTESKKTTPSQILSDDDIANQAASISGIRKAITAVEVVKGVLDIRVLRKIADTDNRANVIEAAKEQIKVLMSDRK